MLQRRGDEERVHERLQIRRRARVRVEPGPHREPRLRAPRREVEDRAERERAEREQELPRPTIPLGELAAPSPEQREEDGDGADQREEREAEAGRVQVT